MEASLDLTKTSKKFSLKKLFSSNFFSAFTLSNLSVSDSTKETLRKGKHHERKFQQTTRQKGAENFYAFLTPIS